MAFMLKRIRELKLLARGAVNVMHASLRLNLIKRMLASLGPDIHCREQAQKHQASKQYVC